MKGREFFIFLGLVCFLFSFSPLSQAAPLGTAFTYQSRLTDGAGPTNGTYDFEFRLYDSLSGGAQVGSSLTQNDIPVSQGLFNAVLDFGTGRFAGDARWLEIGVRPANSGGGFTPLTPRQALTPTPYALYAPSAGTAEAVLWSRINDIPTGITTFSELACTATEVPKWNGSAWSCSQDYNTTYLPGAGLSLTGATFTIAEPYRLPQGCGPNRFPNWNGSTWICSDLLYQYWSLSGNPGTTSGTHFLGTVDSRPLDFRVNNYRAFRIEPDSLSPNILGGHNSNFILSGVSGATIGGGGSAGNSNLVTDSFGTIGGGAGNQAGDNLGQINDKGYATVSGGFKNTASGFDSTIGGGNQNRVTQQDGTVSGGSLNNAFGFGATVGGGSQNDALGRLCVIGGGFDNTAIGQYTTVAGGELNQAAGNHGSIGGGYSNLANGNYSTIGGGLSNISIGDSATVGGGEANEANGSTSTVSGGMSNTASAMRTTVGGGENNEAIGEYATIGGGLQNKADLNYSTVGGGQGNTAAGGHSFVGGGESNSAGDYAVVGGGYDNFAGGLRATIGGGASNSAGLAATVGGGQNNGAVGEESFVGGGSTNQAIGRNTTIGGGTLNSVQADNGTIGGGYHNTIGGPSNTIGGGWGNRATGNASTVPGGASNSAMNHYSFAAGNRATANHDHAFVWGGALSEDTDSWGANTFTIRAHGGVRIYTATNTYAFLASGQTNWNALSDRNAKEHFKDLDHKKILETFSELPIQSWNLKAQSRDMRHIGPMAQDFNGSFEYLFGELESPIHINTMDAIGVSMAAIQGLYQVVQEKETRIETQQNQINALEEQIKRLEESVQILKLSMAGDQGRVAQLTK